MAARIQKDFIFQAGVHFDSRLIMNLYTVTITMYVETEDTRQQNVAMERAKFYIYECLENSVFIQDTENEAIEKYCDANIKVCTLPMEPYDQVISMLLLHKLNSIMEERLTVTEVKTLSKMSDGVTIIYDIDEHPGPFENSGWWTSKRAVINDLNVTKDEDNIVKLMSRPHLSWEEIGLTWEEKEPVEILPSNVVSLRDSS